jgi:hypothetical protein
VKHNLLVERTLRHGDQRLSMVQTFAGGKELRRLCDTQEKCFDAQTSCVCRIENLILHAAPSRLSGLCVDEVVGLGFIEVQSPRVYV